MQLLTIVDSQLAIEVAIGQLAQWLISGDKLHKVEG